jgi:hypothetical protein
MRLPITGGCQCGAVRYAIATAPLTVYACHCTDCQRQSGSAFALSLIAPRDAVRITEGTPAVWERPGSHTASGAPADCLFCLECGARLYNVPSRNRAIAVVKPGTLDDTSWLKPVGHIWTKSAQPWVTFAAGTLLYEAQPPDLAALSEAWQALRRS